MISKWYGKDLRLGVLGGGQLGRMLIQAANDLNIHIHCLDPDPNAPCSEIAHSFSCGSLTDFNTVLNFGSDKHLITVEIENVNVEALIELEKKGVKVFPQPNVLKLIQDKGLQKEFYKKNNIETPLRFTKSANRKSDTLQVFMPQEAKDSIQMVVKSENYLKNYTVKLKKLKQSDSLKISLFANKKFQFNEKLYLETATPIKKINAEKIFLRKIPFWLLDTPMRLVLI